jgi:toxin-antitoxin system PIN domain toxin
MLLPDINVWLALAFDSHIHHPTAKSWFDPLTGDLCFFCRMTQQGFLRLATNQQVFGMHALTLREAWQKYDIFQSDPRISYIGEPGNLETHWRAFTQSQTFSPKVWNDAYLAAFAMAGGLELISFDRGLAQYSGVQFRILL